MSKRRDQVGLCNSLCVYKHSRGTSAFWWWAIICVITFLCATNMRVISINQSFSAYGPLNFLMPQFEKRFFDEVSPHITNLHLSVCSLGCFSVCENHQLHYTEIKMLFIIPSKISAIKLFYFISFWVSFGVINDDSTWHMDFFFAAV